MDDSSTIRPPLDFPSLIDHVAELAFSSAAKTARVENRQGRIFAIFRHLIDEDPMDPYITMCSWTPQASAPMIAELMTRFGPADIEGSRDGSSTFNSGDGSTIAAEFRIGSDWRGGVALILKFKPEIEGRIPKPGVANTEESVRDWLRACHERAAIAATQAAAQESSAIPKPRL